MNNEEKILSILSEMQSEQKKTNDRLMRLEDYAGDLKGSINRFEERMTRVEGSVIRIENDHGAKLNALFDGQKQSAEKLDRIEAEVSRHEEVILRRLP